MEKTVKELKTVIARFAGDSGDGMQLAGNQFSDTTAFVGNDLSTLTDFPAEIRAPAGSLSGVSGFQIQFGSVDIYSPGDEPDVLVAMNPAALKINLSDLKKGGIILINIDAFNKKNLELANYNTNPLEDGSLSDYKVYELPITKSTTIALQDLGLNMKEVTRCKNFYALGIMYWLYNRPLDVTIDWIISKFKSNPKIAEANTRALKAGYNFGETAELLTTRFIVKPAELEKGTYRNVSGNQAVALGILSASLKAGLPLFLGSYPITPASEILQELSAYKEFGVKTFQAEDEISAACAALGASFAGALGFTSTSGPGLVLKSETINLAVMVELPLVIADIQRAGPSTGLPTKTEQGDLLLAIYGRNGESPVPVVAAATPSDCFFMIYEAARIAIKYMTPVYFLSDGFLGNGSEPLKIPHPGELTDIEVKFRKEPNGFEPYQRDENLVRPWAIPGTSGLQHRIGGLEKQNITGDVSHDPKNHEFMVRTRAQKIRNIQNDIPLIEVDGDEEGELLVVGWGSTYGAISSAKDNLILKGYKFSRIHLKYLNPFPKNLGEILKSFSKILVPEINSGQLSKVLRSEFLIDCESFSKVQGLPFKASQIENKIIEILSK